MHTHIEPPEQNQQQQQQKTRLRFGKFGAICLHINLLRLLLAEPTAFPAASRHESQFRKDNLHSLTSFLHFKDI